MGCMTSTVAEGKRVSIILSSLEGVLGSILDLRLLYPMWRIMSTIDSVFFRDGRRGIKSSQQAPERLIPWVWGGEKRGSTLLRLESPRTRALFPCGSDNLCQDSRGRYWIQEGCVECLAGGEGACKSGRMLEGEVNFEGERSGGGFFMEGKERSGGIKGITDGGVGHRRVGRDRRGGVTFRSKRLGMFAMGLEGLGCGWGLSVMLMRGGTFPDVGGRGIGCLGCVKDVLVKDILNGTQWVYVGVRTSGRICCELKRELRWCWLNYICDKEVVAVGIVRKSSMFGGSCAFHLIWE